MSFLPACAGFAFPCVCRLSLGSQPPWLVCFFFFFLNEFHPSSHLYHANLLIPSWEHRSKSPAHFNFIVISHVPLPSISYLPLKYHHYTYLFLEHATWAWKLVTPKPKAENSTCSFSSPIHPFKSLASIPHEHPLPHLQCLLSHPLNNLSREFTICTVISTFSSI